MGTPVFSLVADMFAAVFDVRRVLLWEDDVVCFAKARVGRDILDCVYFFRPIQAGAIVAEVLNNLVFFSYWHKLPSQISILYREMIS